MNKRQKYYIYWHAFHDELIGAFTTKQAAHRRHWIRRDKDKREVEFRLKLFKRAKGIKLDEYNEHRLSDKEILELHKKQCPRCSWGKGIYEDTIFTAKKWKSIRPYDMNLNENVF